MLSVRASRAGLSIQEYFAQLLRKALLYSPESPLNAGAIPLGMLPVSEQLFQKLKGTKRILIVVAYSTARTPYVNVGRVSEAGPTHLKMEIWDRPSLVSRATMYLWMEADPQQDLPLQVKEFHDLLWELDHRVCYHPVARHWLENG